MHLVIYDRQRDLRGSPAAFAAWSYGCVHGRRAWLAVQATGGWHGQPRTMRRRRSSGEPPMVPPGPSRAVLPQWRRVITIQNWLARRCRQPPNTLRHHQRSGSGRYGPGTLCTRAVRSCAGADLQLGTACPGTARVVVTAALTRRGAMARRWPRLCAIAGAKAVKSAACGVRGAGKLPQAATPAAWRAVIQATDLR